MSEPSPARKRLYWAIAMVAVLGVAAASVWWVTDRYSILVYRKHEIAPFAEMMRHAEVTHVENRNAETGDMEISPAMGKLDLRRAHPYCAFRAQPSVYGAIDQGPSAGTFHINALGFRSPKLEQKRPGTRRLAMLGGSAVWLGSTNDKTIPAQLARMLTGHGVETDYVNAGIVSAVSSQELSVLVHDLLDLDVDLVVSLDGFNDIVSVTRFNGRVGTPAFQPKGVEPYYAPLPPEPDLSAEKLKLTLMHYLNVVRKMSTICRAFGIHYVAVLQPAQLYREQRESIASGGQLPLVVFYETAAEFFDAWDEKRFNGGHFVSLADLLHEDMFWDPVHFRDEGNTLVADALFNMIVDRGILEEPPSPCASVEIPIPEGVRLSPSRP